MSGTSNKKWKTAAIWIVMILAFIVFFTWQTGPKEPKLTSYGQFAKAVENDEVDEVWSVGNTIIYKVVDDSDRREVIGPIDNELQRKIHEKDIVFHQGVMPPENRSTGWLTWLIVPGIIVLVIFLLLRARAKRNGGLFVGNVLKLGKSRAVLIDGEKKVTFADVGGCDEAKLALGDIIDFLKRPEPWIAAGARLPRGVLLDGPPGCGKTLLARAAAGETNAKFYAASGSEFVEMFIGVGAARVRDMFETAAKNAPAIIFIDELDAIGRRRGGEITVAGHNEREQTLNQLLINLDGFKASDRVVVLAATNRAEILDPALLRPGRFDRRVCVPQLSRDARLAVLTIHTRNKRVGPGVLLEEWADHTAGFNGAQLEGLANEAALLAVRRLRNDAVAEVAISCDDLSRALESLRPKPSQFDKLDEVLVEANSQVARPSGRAMVRLTLTDGAVQEGEIAWADAAFIKILDQKTRKATIVPKRHVMKMSALPETEALAAIELPANVSTEGPSARREPETT